MEDKYSFSEQDLTVSGTAEDLLELVECIEAQGNMSNKWSDLAYTIRYHLDEGFCHQVSR